MSVAASVVLAPSALPLDHVVVKKERINPVILTQLLSHPDITDEARTALRAYQRRVKEGRVEVHYTLGYKVKASEEFSGRYYPKGGLTLQGLPREVRNLLAGEFYYDVDLKNAQPTLLLQMARKRGLVCPVLDEFCADRETLLRSFCEDRDEAKKMVMKALYGGSTEGMPPFLQRLGDEVRLITQTLVSLHLLAIPPSLRKNSPASLAAYLLQSEEKKCLMEMEKALHRRGWDMEVLIHDGGLVARREDAVLNEAVLREVEKEVETATGYAVELALKPMKSNIVMEHAVDEYAAMKAEFEMTHFKVMSPFQFVRVDGEELQLMSQADLRGCYHNKLLRDGKSFIERWLADPTMLTYAKMVFAPMGEPPKGCYNTFQGWKVKPVEGDASAVHRLLDLIAHHDEAVKTYLLKYHAWMVQRPHIKTGICIIYASERHGTGKDTWTNFFAGLLGSRYTSNTSDPANNWFGRFTAHLEHCVYAKCEELTFADSKQHSNRFKGNITATEITYEDKGVRPYNAKSYTNYAATTNNLVPVLLEDKERRFVLLNPSDEKAGDCAFWREMYAELGKPEVQSAFMNELMNLDLTGFDPRENRPITELYEEIATQQAPFHAKFFQFLLETDTFPNGFITGGDLTRRLNDYLRTYVPNFPPRTPQAVGKALQLYVEAGAMEKHRYNYGQSYVLDAEKTIAFLREKKWYAEA